MTELSVEFSQMMACSQAVQTKHLGPTKHRGHRIKARLLEGRPSDGKLQTLTVPYVDPIFGKSPAQQHRAVAIKLLGTKVWAEEWNMSKSDGEKDFRKSFYIFSGSCDKGYIFLPILRKIIDRR